MEDVQNIGGTPGMTKFLIDNGLFDRDQMTVMGKTHNENLADLNHPGLTPGQEIIRPLSNPIKATGHLQIMYRNLCPGGGVAKITGKEGKTFTGTARVYDNEQLMLRGLENKEIKCGDVVIICYEGPINRYDVVQLAPTSLLILGLLLLSSWTGSRGSAIASCCSRTDGSATAATDSASGTSGRRPRPMALVKNGDLIHIDVCSDKWTINLFISDKEWEERRKAWSLPPLRASPSSASPRPIAEAAPKTPAVAELEAKLEELEAKAKGLA
ncbi:LOW QUALITY PROTEIN: hypothetical protein ACHAWF_002331 [Thalassiosira exigua]